MAIKDVGALPAMGVTIAGDGIDIAVHSPDAEAVAVCLFDERDQETRRIRLPDRTGPLHHGHVAGVTPGTRYGLRAFGPWQPSAGLRFNGAKLLVDPWATAIDRPFKLHDLLFDRDGPRPEDTAALMPKGIVGAPDIRSVGDRPRFDWDRQVIYELHVRGFTKTHPDIPPAIRGTFAALGHPAAIAHLLRLGISTVELMPSAAWVDERHLPALNLTDYWGYNPVAFLAPDPRLAPGGWTEVRAAVDALHAAGLSVILDVVLNHSGESDELGPTLSLRGLDNAGYYRLRADRSLYVNDAGCGNVLAMDRPAALRLGMDALRAWAIYAGLDGFRLDLAATLGRRADGFDRNAPFLEAIEQDPVLSRCVMIAEPWDIGPGGYQLGAFPDRWGEWNDRFRDTVRRFWRGDNGMLGEFTTRFAGSADIFRGRPLSRSINYVTAHDGFPLADLVAYQAKRNQANGEDNRDGTDDNLSWNHGIDGPSEDPVVIAARARDVRALLATLLLSRGTPMLSMGDELGRTQHGNNNAYAQDNAGSWIDWRTADDTLTSFTAAAVAVRRSLSPFFGGNELRGQPIGASVLPDVTWCGPDGLPIGDWAREANHTVIAVLFAGDTRAALVFHANSAIVDIELPESRPGFAWDRALDSAGIEQGATVSGRSVVVFLEIRGELPGHLDGSGNLHQPTLTVGHTPIPVPARLGPQDSEVDQLADLAGIDPIWWDIDGGRHAVTMETKRTLLRAMRLPADSRADLQSSSIRLRFEPVLPRAVTVRAGDSIPIHLGHPRPAWVTLMREDGSYERFPIRDGSVALPPQPMGRHRLLNEDRPEQACYLTIAPDTCYLPDVLTAGERRFGIAAHLYALRSVGDQGIGDFTTLSRFAATAAEAGASLVGLNPMHALFPHDRSRASPYHPSDRRFLDPIYIDVSGLAGGAELPSPYGSVDYPSVWERKRAVLLAAFRRTEPAAIEDSLRRFARFEAIAEVRGSSDWHLWPTELRHPEDPGVAAFAADHADIIGFHAFMQTLADRQFRDAASNALPLGFYRDLAVGAAPDGAEAWSAQDTLMRGVSIGAPPDPFSAAGQIWCLPPPDPVAMRRDGFQAFNALLVANMQYAGALRIDHVMGLRRLFVVPDGATAADGAYVTYPMEDLLAQVALQSQRVRCVVVGEDLGTVPAGMSDALAASNVLSYSVLWFERQDGHIRPPTEWRRLAASCVSTHDLPTLAGWWAGTDIAEKRALWLVLDPDADPQRTREKAELVAQLQAGHFLAEGDIDLAAPLPIAVSAAVHAFVSATPSLLTLVQADDLAGELVAVNLPGTDRERPNWRRRLDRDVGELCKTPLAQAILGAMRERGARAKSSSA